MIAAPAAVQGAAAIARTSAQPAKNTPADTAAQLDSRPKPLIESAANLETPVPAEQVQSVKNASESIANQAVVLPTPAAENKPEEAVIPEPVAVPQLPAEPDADGPDVDESIDESVSSDSGPDEGAWAGMPEEGWGDDGRWGDDAEVDVGLPVHAQPPMEADEAAAPEVSGGYASTAQNAAPVERTPEGDLWFGVVQELLASEAVVAVARQLALQSQLVAREGDLWHLRVESSSLNQVGTRDRLRAALEAAGHARQLQVELGPVTDSPARRLALERQASQLLAEDIVKSNPQVQALMRDFGAKIVPGSIKPISIQPE